MEKDFFFRILLSQCNAQMKLSWIDICAIQINKYYHYIIILISVKQFFSVVLRIADKNRRRVELSSSVLRQTLGK